MAIAQARNDNPGARKRRLPAGFQKWACAADLGGRPVPADRALRAMSLRLRALDSPAATGALGNRHCNGSWGAGDFGRKKRRSRGRAVRTAHKVWAWIAAGVFCVVAVTDLSNGSSAASSTASSPSVAAASSPSASSPSFDPDLLVGPLAVKQVTTPANLVLSSGVHVHVTMMNGILPWNGQYTSECERNADLQLARKLLLGKSVTVIAPPKSEDADAVVPAGHIQVDLTVSGSDYARMFEAQGYDARDTACPPPTFDPPASAPSSDSSGGVDVDVETPHYHNLPDGTLTGGYCARKWWC